MKALQVCLIVIITVLLSVFQSPEGAESQPLEIPFTLDRHRVIVPVRVNGSRPLQLILDTGMGFNGVYLFHREAALMMDTAGAVQVRVPGAGAGEASSGIMIENGRITAGDLTADGQRVVVAGSEYTQRFPTDGVIGWTLFGHYIVEINYDRLEITLYDSTYSPADSGWTGLPLELKENLPWIKITTEVIEGEAVPMQVYIDLASGDVLELLTGPGQRFRMPAQLTEQYLGTGLSGDIHGSTGVTHRVQIARYELYDLPTSFAPAEVRSRQDGADGILGNGFIEHFNVIFDYYRGRLYLHPNESAGGAVEVAADTGR
jgi:hypothetical protein